MVSETLSPLAAEELCASEKPRTCPPSSYMAASKLSLVRVEGSKHNWAEGQVENEVRLGIIAAIEKEILSVFYTVPLQNHFSASLKSYKSDYISRDYNTFMAYGGIEYLTYAYDDAEWEEYCKNNTLDYKQ